MRAGKVEGEREGREGRCRQHQFVVFLLRLEQVCSTITYTCVESAFVEASFHVVSYKLMGQKVYTSR